jgi:hypothetical protein
MGWGGNTLPNAAGRIIRFRAHPGNGIETTRSLSLPAKPGPYRKYICRLRLCFLRGPVWGGKVVISGRRVRPVKAKLAEAPLPSTAPPPGDQLTAP